MIPTNLPRRKDDRKKINYSKWKGENRIVSATQINRAELSNMVDCQLVEDGKIQIPRSGQAYYGSTSGSKVTGIFPYYKSDGTKKLLRTSGTTLQVLNTSTNNWDTVSGYTYTTGLDTEGILAYDKLYICNGTDPLTYYNGSTITSFTAISAPGTPTATRTGTTGSYTFSYKITAVTNTGETTPSAAGTSDLNVATLDSTNYMTITWSAVTSAIGYNIYGRKANSWYLIKYLDGNSSTSYVDKGTDTPNEMFTPPTQNSTAGPKGKYVQVYKDTLFIFGDPNDPSRLYYSGGGDKIEDFSAANGGGFIDISKNDGQMGTGMIPFKNSLITFKEKSIYQFSFATTGAPQVVQITAAVGCTSSRSIVAVENDVMFANERGIFSVGNIEGFAFDVLRTNELSVRERPEFQSMAQNRVKNISAVYANKTDANLVIFTYTPNGGSYNCKAIVFDRERAAWYRWNNICANCWTNYTDINGNTHVLYGDDNSGYIKEILTGTDDFGTPIVGTIDLISESFDGIDTYKKLQDFSMVLRKPQGAVLLTLIKDGTSTVYQSNVTTISPSINLGHYIMSRFLLGQSYGSGAITTSDEIVLKTKRNVNILGKSFMARFSNSGTGSSFTLLEFSMTVKPRSDRFRQSQDLL